MLRDGTRSGSSKPLGPRSGMLQTTRGALFTPRGALMVAPNHSGCTLCHSGPRSKPLGALYTTRGALRHAPNHSGRTQACNPLGAHSGVLHTTWGGALYRGGHAQADVTFAHKSGPRIWPRNNFLRKDPEHIWRKPTPAEKYSWVSPSGSWLPGRITSASPCHQHPPPSSAAKPHDKLRRLHLAYLDEPRPHHVTNSKA